MHTLTPISLTQEGIRGLVKTELLAPSNCLLLLLVTYQK